MANYFLGSKLILIVFVVTSCVDSKNDFFISQHYSHGNCCLNLMVNKLNAEEKYLAIHGLSKGVDDKIELETYPCYIKSITNDTVQMEYLILTNANNFLDKKPLFKNSTKITVEFSYRFLNSTILDKEVYSDSFAMKSGTIEFFKEGTKIYNVDASRIRCDGKLFFYQEIRDSSIFTTRINANSRIIQQFLEMQKCF